jgi:antirestriction protein ArdC
MDNFKKQEITTIDSLALFYLRLTRYRASKLKKKASRNRIHNYRKSYKKIRAIDHFYEMINVQPDKQYKSFKKLYKLGGKVRDIENETKLLYRVAHLSFHKNDQWL